MRIKPVGFDNYISSEIEYNFQAGKSHAAAARITYNRWRYYIQHSSLILFEYYLIEYEMVIKYDFEQLNRE